ncbi:MAG: hypothetical protein JFR38_10290 [Muribaculaceae bacterium]|nr:hypothetical protein [Muribaculaceae bacterium]
MCLIGITLKKRINETFINYYRHCVLSYVFHSLLRVLQHRCRCGSHRHGRGQGIQSGRFR